MPGSEILLVFELGTMTATAGCNIMFGDYEIDDDILRWSDAPARTQRACRDEAAAQDDWLTALLTAYGEGTGTQYWMSGSWHAVKTASASSSRCRSPTTRRMAASPACAAPWRWGRPPRSRTW